MPETLSLVGFDDAPSARDHPPTKLEIAAVAVDLLVGPGVTRGPQTLELPYTLLRRPSSRPAPT